MKNGIITKNYSKIKEESFINDSQTLSSSGLSSSLNSSGFNETTLSSPSSNNKLSFIKSKGKYYFF